MARTALALLAVVQILAHAVSAQSPLKYSCGKTSNKIGYQGLLMATPSGHTVTGAVTIIDDCTFVVSDFTQTPPGPDVYFWGAPSAPALRQSGRRISDFQIVGSVTTPTTLTLQFDPATTSWASIGVVSVWCEQFNANFAFIDLTTAPVLAPAPVDVTAVYGRYDHCVTLLPGRLNLLWSAPFANGTVVMAVQSSFNQAYGWCGVGISNPALGELSMISADIVLAGFDLPGNPFAIPYMVSRRQQCDYSATRTAGVCPRNADAASQVILRRADRTATGIVTVEFLRPTVGNAAQGFRDIDFASSRILWAMGPLADVSSGDINVLIHKPSEHASSDSRITLGLTTGNACSPIIAQVATAPPSQSTAIQTVDGAVITSFNITIGPSPNYPNKPAWGVSYHINGLESPVLRVVRGITYTFTIKASSEHPLYLTSDIVGGLSNPVETVYGGGKDAFGDDIKPFKFQWTPDANTPADLFYQCTTHRKLGWRITVVDKASSTSSAWAHSRPITAQPMVAIVTAAALITPALL